MGDFRIQVVHLVQCKLPEIDPLAKSTTVHLGLKAVNFKVLSVSAQGMFTAAVPVLNDYFSIQLRISER